MPFHHCLQPWPLDRVLYLTASAENGSEHPLARALLSYAALRLEGGAALLQEQPAELPALADGSGTADGSSPAVAGAALLAAGDATEPAMQAALLASQVSRQAASGCESQTCRLHPPAQL